ncbi:MAG: OmpH family outer membrane protein [Verrucomicrobia bacterium]|nr:MAG: OmpH family outer membrane protein [Verrucomicrobiota bacterium]
MKYSKITKILFSLASLILVTSHLQAETKIGIVDMNRIFSEYDKTKKTQAEYEVLEKNANKELDTRIDQLKKEVDAIDKLNTDLEKPDLNNDIREGKQKERETKIAQAKKLDEETTAFRSNKEKKFQEEFSKTRKTIIDDIMIVINEQTKIRGFDLLLDKSGLSAGAVPVVLYSRPDLDISSDIIAILNKKGAAK